MAQLIREAIEEKAMVKRPRLKSLGIADSGDADIARTAATERAPARPWR